MKNFNLGDGYSVVCEFKKTRMAFKHEATILKNGSEIYKTKIYYQNRTWESYEFQDVIHKAIRNHFGEPGATEFIKIADNGGAEMEAKRFDPLKTVCAIGNLLCETADEKAKWTKRMLSTVPGLDFPDDFDSLPAEERERRLNNAVKVL